MEKISSDRLRESARPKRKRSADRRVDYYEPQAMYRDEVERPRRSSSARRKRSRYSPVTLWKNMKDVLTNRNLAFDNPLLIIVLLLLLVGLVMMYSASYAYAFYKMRGDSLHFARRQLIFAIAGVVAMIGVSTISPHRYKGKIANAMMLLSYALLVVVLFMPRVNGVRRWIGVGSASFQPTEIAKFAAILWCASYITDHYKEINLISYSSLAVKERVNRSRWKKALYGLWRNFRFSVLPFGLVFAPMLGLIVIEPHLSCTILMVLIIGTQMFVGGTKKAYFAVLGALSVIMGYLVIYTNVVPYGGTRIRVWKDPFVDPLKDGWQNIQSLYAISSGGLMGVGIGNSRQKYLYISEPQNDFIFAVICEEVGLIGAMLIILLFVLFVWRGFAVSLAHGDRFCRLVGVGITSQIGFQMILNICVVTKMVPNTGISLPFFSYGGTSLTMLLMEIGVLLAISRGSAKKTRL